MNSETNISPEAAKAELLEQLVERLSAAKNAPRWMYTDDGGINLNRVAAYEVSGDSVIIFHGERHQTLRGRFAAQFLKMVGDKRARDERFAGRQG